MPHYPRKKALYPVIRLDRQVDVCVFLNEDRSCAKISIHSFHIDNLNFYPLTCFPSIVKYSNGVHLIECPRYPRSPFAQNCWSLCRATPPIGIASPIEATMSIMIHLIVVCVVCSMYQHRKVSLLNVHFVALNFLFCLPRFLYVAKRSPLP